MSILDSSNQVPIKHINRSLSFSDAVTTPERISSNNPGNIANKFSFLNAEQMPILSVPSQNIATDPPLLMLSKSLFLLSLLIIQCLYPLPLLLSLLRSPQIKSENAWKISFRTRMHVFHASKEMKDNQIS